MIFTAEKPTAFTKFGEWRLFLLQVMTVFYTYSTAACEAFVVWSTCNEILLKTALLLTNSIACHLSIMLKLNAFLRLMLTRMLLTKEDLDGCECASCSTWLPSQPIRRNSCSEFCCRRRGAARRLESAQDGPWVLPSICQRWASVCVSLFHTARSIPSALCSKFRLIVSIVTVLWRCIWPLLTVFQVLGAACNMWTI